MMKRGLLVAWFCFFGISVFAQEDPVLMRVNGKDILRSRFYANIMTNTYDERS